MKKKDDSVFGLGKVEGAVVAKMLLFSSRRWCL